LSRSYIGEIENGQCNVTLHTLLLLAVALDVQPTVLVEPLNTRPELYPRPKHGAL
jgi:transcriptional regulator with XRE-family HTH domain